MKIVHYEPLTLVDYPGQLSATVFTHGCVFRCPFCHSPELADPTHVDYAAARAHDRTEDFFRFLATRRSRLDGVCITGGEPTLHADLPDFIRRIRDMGFCVKLDTNGALPDRVAAIAAAGIVDYWAMDVKQTPDKYALAAGVAVDTDAIDRSIRTIMGSGAAYEFRTTVVPGIHTDADLDGIAAWIDGAAAYYMQPFRDIKILAPELRARATAAAPIDLAAAAARLSPHFGHVGVRV